MEEDIKILEENINNGIIYCGCGYTTEKAIEHLISSYKKLEEENKELNKELEETNQRLQEIELQILEEGE